MNRVELKQQAKDSLKGKYKETIKLLLVVFLIEFVISLLGGNGEEVTSMTYISQILSIALAVLLEMGTVSFFLKISRNQEVTFKELFSKVNLWLPYLIIALTTSIFTLLWSILFIIPGIITAISYSLVYYILLDNPGMKTTEIISKSKEMMKGHKMDYVILNLSFLGWAILGAFTLGILYFWLIPYIAVTNANFYNKIKESN